MVCLCANNPSTFPFSLVPNRRHRIVRASIGIGLTVFQPYVPTSREIAFPVFTLDMINNLVFEKCDWRSFLNLPSGRYSSTPPKVIAMRLHCFLMAVAATLAVLNDGITTTEAASLRKVPDIAPTSSINAVQPETRRLRSTESVYRHEDSKKRRPFIEEKLQKALTNPKKTQRLYAKWYKSGFTTKQVTKGLDQSENRELDNTYKNLAKGYTVYFNERRAQQQSA